MATLTTQTVSQSGLTPSYASAAGGGDKCAPGARTFLHVKNGDSASHTVTVVTPGTVSGLAIGDLAVAVPAGEERMIGPITADLFAAASDGLAAITYSAATGVTIAAIQI